MRSIAIIISTSPIAFITVTAWSSLPTPVTIHPSTRKEIHHHHRHHDSRTSRAHRSSDNRARCSLQLSSSSKSSSSSYETCGDGQLISETFSDLYSQNNNDDEPSSASSSSSQESRPNNQPYIPQWLLDRASKLGYTHPTLLQQRALDILLPKKYEYLNGQTNNNNNNNVMIMSEEEEEENYPPDVILHAQTGSGKTLAFLLPLLSRIDVTRSAVQALVVVPTRELGLQVVRVARRLSAGVAVAPTSVDRGDYDDDDDDDDDENVSIAMDGEDNDDNIIGDGNGNRKIMIMPLLQGSSNTRQKGWAWSDPPHIIVGTPTELSRMVTRGGVRVNAVKMVVVDEVDACLGKGGISALGSTGSGTLHELLSRHLNPTYQEVERVNTSIEGKDGRRFNLSVSADTGGGGGVDVGGGQLLDGAASSLPNGYNFYADKHRQTVFASATIPQHNHFMRQCVRNGWTLREPVRVNVSPGELVPPTLKHVYVVCRDKSTKVMGMRRWMKKELGSAAASETAATTDGGVNNNNKVLVFCDPRRPLETLAAMLAKDWNGVVWKEGYAAGEGDGYDAVISVLRLEESPGARAAAMEGFRGPAESRRQARTNNGAYVDAEGNGDRGGDDRDDADDGKLRIMLSTDLAARGLDVSGISHVINFDLPNDNGGDTYVHRGGRAGRLGKKGKVVSLITADQEFVLERLANKLSLDLRCVARQESEKKKKGVRTKKTV